jgi:hypothetical protein
MGFILVSAGGRLTGMSDPPTPTSDPTTDKPPRRRRWIPRSLRMFVAILALLAGGSALWIGVPAYRQYVAMRNFERVGGHIVTVKSRPTWWPWEVPPGEADAPLSMFNEPQGAYAGPVNSISDADLASLRALPTLRAINLSQTRVSDDGMQHLIGATRLEFLILDQTQISDAGLTILQELRNLRMLGVQGTRVTDAGVAELNRASPNLRVVR